MVGFDSIFIVLSLFPPQAAHMLSTTPAVMKECLQSLSQPQQMRNIIKYQEEANVEMKGYHVSFFLFKLIFSLCWVKILRRSSRYRRGEKISQT